MASDEEEGATFNGMRAVVVPSMPPGTWRILPALPWRIIVFSMLPREERNLYIAAGGEITEPVLIVHSIEDARQTYADFTRARRDG